MTAPGQALLVATWEPPVALGVERGMSHRMRLLLHALDRAGLRTTLACFATPEFIAAHPVDDALLALQAAYWGVPVGLRLIPRRARRETLVNHYLLGIAQAGEQPQLQTFAGPEQGAALAEVLDSAPWDLVVASRLSAMLAIERSGRRPARMVFDLCDIDSEMRRREALVPPLWPGKLAYLAHVPALRAAERRGAARSAMTWVCSEADRDLLARRSPRFRFEAVPNAMPAPSAPSPPCPEPTLLLLGPTDHPPNAATARRLVTRVLPLVRRAIPEARALIGGAGTDRLPATLPQTEGAEFLGFVEDLDALYRRSRVICCPMDIGGGTRLKLIEAAGRGRPIVATAIGAEGLDFADGEEILIRESDEAIAEACVRLLRDDALCARLGAAARARMVATYDAGRISERVAEMLAPLLGR